MNVNNHPELFKRHKRNPILTAADWPYAAHAIYNAGAVLLPDGDTLLLCRVEDRRGLSHLTVARSANGIDGWRIDPKPTFEADPANFPEELWGLEDPRITWVEEFDKYVIAYTAFGQNGPGVSLALTKDFVKFERLGLVMQPADKDAALLPRRYNGNFLLIHRPMTDASADIWVSHSPDLLNWGGHELMLPAHRGAWWDANKIGLAGPLIETAQGWLMLYHGVRVTASGSLYRLGVALFDLENPAKCIRRGLPWMFGPEEPYELLGNVPNVAFPCGHTILADGDTIHLYYGGADTCMALAIGSISETLDWLDRNGTDYTGVAGQPEEMASLLGTTATSSATKKTQRIKKDANGVLATDQPT